MGQVPICKCGYVKLWHGVVFSAENSQHISDWYTFSHIIHGFGFYGLLWLVGRRWPIGVRLVLAVLLESGVGDLREHGHGHQPLSRGDDLARLLRRQRPQLGLRHPRDGRWAFWPASRLPVWTIVLLTVAMELVVLWYIRDNLTLNILMLVYPLESIKQWQGGG